MASPAGSSTSKSTSCDLSQLRADLLAKSRGTEIIQVSETGRIVDLFRREEKGLPTSEKSLDAKAEPREIPKPDTKAIERRNALKAMAKLQDLTPIDHLEGQVLFGTLIDSSPELTALIAKAETYKSLPFEKKLQKVIQLTLEGLPINAFDKLAEGSSDLIENEYPLSKALKQKMGCCRYQGALFFILSHAALLGDFHYLQAAHIRGPLYTVFNQIVHGGKSYIVSLFLVSLKDREQDYTKGISDILQSPDLHLPTVVYDGSGHVYTTSGCYFRASKESEASESEPIPSPIMFPIVRMYKASDAEGHPMPEDHSDQPLEFVY